MTKFEAAHSAALREDAYRARGWNEGARPNLRKGEYGGCALHRVRDGQIVPSGFMNDQGRLKEKWEPSDSPYFALRAAATDALLLSRQIGARWRSVWEAE